MKVLTVPWLFFFQLLLDLKNVSSSSRQLRLTPPATKYFSVGLGRFPGEHGVVAPGLSCQYPIKFAPDSLADYDDIIKVNLPRNDNWHHFSLCNFMAINLHWIVINSTCFNWLTNCEIHTFHSNVLWALTWLTV